MSATGVSSGTALPVPATVAVASDLPVDKEHKLLMARQRVDRIIDAFGLPLTRPQWEVWLNGCLTEFRDRMRADAAPAVRRRGATRICARPGMRAGVGRIQAMPEYIAVEV